MRRECEQECRVVRVEAPQLSIPKLRRGRVAFVTLLARRRARRGYRDRCVTTDRARHCCDGRYPRARNSWWLDRTHRTRLSVIFQEHTDLSRSWKNASSCKCQRSRRSCADSHVVISGRRFAGRRSSRCTRRRNVVKRFVVAVVVAGIGAGFAPALVLAGAQTAPREGTARGAGAAGFQVEEATIDDLHRAIQDGRTTCAAVVRAYVERARAYNGSCTQLVTSDGAPDRPRARHGAGRRAAVVSRRDAGGRGHPAGLSISHRGCRSSTDGWSRPGPIPTCSSSTAWWSASPNAGQVNALSTLNHPRRTIGHVQGACDAPSVDRTAAGELSRRLRDVPAAAGCARACRGARRAVRPAPGSRSKLPMYCVAMSFKDVYDTTDMRSTGGADVDYAMDAPPAGLDHRRRSCARRAPSSTPRRTSPSTTAAAAIPAAPPSRPRATSVPARAARGAARPAIPTTRRARPADRARGRRPRSAPTSSRARSARRPAARAASPRGATASSRWSRRRA